MPIPIATIDILDKDNSQLFPCRCCPCGCKTAEQCWSSCCCFTPAERLAWAEKNGITPPSYAQRPANDEVATHKKSTASRENENVSRIKSESCGSIKTCCDNVPDKSVAKLKKVDSGKPDCCSSKPKSTCDSCSQSAKTNTSKPGVVISNAKRKIVVSIYELKCQGKSSSFNLLPWMILATHQMAAVIGNLFGPAHHAAIKDPLPVFLKPDTPPPKQLLQ